MSRLRRVTGRQVLKALQRAGFVLIRTKGSHHFETLGPGLFNQILKDTEIERGDFDKLL